MPSQSCQLSSHDTFALGIQPRAQPDFVERNNSDRPPKATSFPPLAKSVSSRSPRDLVIYGLLVCMSSDAHDGRYSPLPGRCPSLVTTSSLPPPLGGSGSLFPYGVASPWGLATPSSVRPAAPGPGRLILCSHGRLVATASGTRTLTFGLT